MKPDPSVSIALVLIIPFLFILNIAVATVLFFLKRNCKVVFCKLNNFSNNIYAMWNLCFLDYQERNNKAYYFKNCK